MNTAALIDTGPLGYLDRHGTLVWSPARTWLLDDDGGTVVTVLTGPQAVAEASAVRTLLESGIYRGKLVRIIEHHTDEAGHPSYAEQWRRPDTTIHRRPIAADTLRALLGPLLDATTPTGPVVDGTYTSALTTGR
ncbi:hypothetical protein ACWD2L_00315 [Streptomyces sp. NPDC002754]